MRCYLHQHDANVYGQTTYGNQTCPQCFLAVYLQKGKTKVSNSRRAHDTVNLRIQDEQNLLSSNNKRILFDKEITDPNNPLIDTVSHFPSPAGEAIFGVYQGHLPMFNREDEIRPSEVPRFMKKVHNNQGEIYSGFKSLYGKVAEDSSYVDTKNYEQLNPNDISENKDKDDESIVQSQEKLEEIDMKSFYKTTTQRMYEDIDWRSKLLPKRQPPALKPFRHDTRQLEKQIMRYKDYPQSSLNSVPLWDRSQSRDSYHCKRPIEFCSISKQSQQIPNYQGCMSGFGEKDNIHETFTPLTVVRTTQPKQQEFSIQHRFRGNADCALWNSAKRPSTENLALKPECLSTRPIARSRVGHQSLLSKTVSLTHPFVPNNRIDYSVNRTASGNRVF